MGNRLRVRADLIMSIAQKVHFVRSQNRFAERKIADALQLVGKFLPASVVSVSGPIVTVKFEISSSFTLPQVTMPVAGSEYVRLPIQPGCKGMVISADARLGAMSGLATGTADLSQPANLSALVFVPLGNKFWDMVDGNALVLIGLDQVQLVAPNVSTSANMAVGTGATGSFTTGTGQIVTVQDGIVINIY